MSERRVYTGEEITRYVSDDELVEIIARHIEQRNPGYEMTSMVPTLNGDMILTSVRCVLKKKGAGA